MSSMKSALANFEQTINNNETAGCKSKSFISNIVKVPSSGNLRKPRRAAKRPGVTRDSSDETVTSIDETTVVSYLTEESISLEGVPDSHSQRCAASDSALIGMVMTTESETAGVLASKDMADSKDDAMSEFTGKKQQAPPNNDRVLMLSWEELVKANAGARNPQKDTGGTLSLKDRMNAFNASCGSMEGASFSQLGEMSMTSLDGPVPENEVTTPKEKNAVEDKLKEAEVENESSEDRNEDKPAPEVHTMNEPAVRSTEVTAPKTSNKYVSQCKAKDKVDESKETQVKQDDSKDRANCELQSGMEDLGIKNTSSISDDRVLMLSWGELVRANAGARKPQKDTGGTVSLKDRMNAFNASCGSMGGASFSQLGEMSMTSLDGPVPEVQTENEGTTAKEKSTAEDKLKEAEVENESSKDRNEDKPAPEVHTMNEPAVRSTEVTAPKKSNKYVSQYKAKDKLDESKETQVKQDDSKDRANCELQSGMEDLGIKNTSSISDDRVLMLSWGELVRANAGARKPQKDTGGTVSLKDRMNAFNASCGSMGGASFSQLGEMSLSSLVPVPEVQTENEVTTAEEKNAAEDKLKEAEVEKESSKDRNEDTPRTDGTADESNDKRPAIEIKKGSRIEATDKKQQAPPNDDRVLMLSWEELVKANAGARNPQKDTGGTASIKDRMNAFNASCSSMGGASLDSL